ncbi:glucosamine inositolphosphorylceramide transferase family protein [Kozakia baliensis]|uniref:glucosamine inositolphosphorylceramide transferase family protein n=1 Tax=Kozakia baliensis TaxID=153496 RepID=UPI00087BA8EA|nr:formyl transferase [Kozakia baliensis]AOX20998.1 formyl transferase [Kozakia baliensis]
MGLRKDIWRSAICMASIEDIVARGAIGDAPVHWLPPMSKPFQFLADPFGFWRDGKLHVFAEAYDYRDRIGKIELFVYDEAFCLLSRCIVLSEPWHLSYPFVFEAEGEIWMLPEAFRSGALTLYRAVSFPDRWEPECRIDLGDDIPVDATVTFHDGLWWMFYTPARPGSSRPGCLNVAYAEHIRGPWTRHPLNPVRTDSASTRPGGTAKSFDGRVMLPVQDCSWTYGGAIRPLWFDALTPEIVLTHAGGKIGIPPRFGRYREGMHTLSAAGDVTLIDVKRTEFSPRGLSIEAIREGKKLMRRFSQKHPLA